MTKACYYPGCQSHCEPGHIYCRRHWGDVPRYIRLKIWNTFRKPGQHAAYLEARNDAQRALEEKDARRLEAVAGGVCTV